MQAIRTLFTCLAVAFFMSAVADAQNDDPFGGGGDAADPFNSKPAARAKPAATADPFGGGGAADPFAANEAPRRADQPKPKPSTVKKINRSDEKAAIARIRSTLDHPTTQSFIETPLVEAVQQLSRFHDIPIVVDRRALEEVGLTPDTPVNLDLKNVSLRSFLRLMLRELDLTYVIEDEVLQVLTHEAAQNRLTVEMYHFPDALTAQSDKVLEALTSSVQTENWTVSGSGGKSNASVIENVLVISAPEALHEDVIDFVQKLEKAFGNYSVRQ